MGSVSYALYLSLLSEIEGEKHYSSDKSHQWLMNMMSVTMDQLYRSRLRLEAIGLLKTYEIQEDDQATDHFFEYEILPPLSPEQFFTDDILSICLYNQIGTQRYKTLRASYSSYLLSDDKGNFIPKKEVTKEFHEVFTSIHPSELVAMKGTEIQRELQLLDETYPIHKESNASSNKPKYGRYQIDIDVLKGFLMKGLQADSVLTKAHVEQLKKIAYFYRLDEWSLSRLIHDSLTADDDIDLLLLRERAKEWYRLQQGGKPPRLIQMIQPISQRVIQENKIQTEEERKLYHLETTSPIDLLEAYQGGGKIAEADVKLLEELLFDYELLPGVVNVLVEYILLTNQFKLPKNLVTKVAGHWKRSNILNVKQAQELAIKEHQQYKEWKSKSKDSDKSSERKYTGPKGSNAGVRKDKLPKWIEDQAAQERKAAESSAILKEQDATKYKETITNPRSTESATMSDQQKRERMETLLKALGEWDDEKGGE
jgi:replication initiation and membrane attachment protein